MTHRDDFSQAIVILRGNRTQEEVARRAGIDPTVWSLYERGRRRPRSKNLARVLVALGCTRLDFEEVRWSLRRRELQDEDPTRASSPLSPDLQIEQKPRSGVRDEMLEADLRAAVGQLARALERALLLLARESGGGANLPPR